MIDRTDITAIVSSGDYKGELMFPHKYPDGYYVASPSRFEEDYIRVQTLEELYLLAKAGYRIRMSSPKSPNPPSGIRSHKLKLNATHSIRLAVMLKNASSDANLDRDSVGKSRREQAYLRTHLLNYSHEGVCVICRTNFPSNLLVAAHLKKRSKCNDNERLDFDNIAALMCKFGCDDLYEKGYIGVVNSIVQENTNLTKYASVNKQVATLKGNKVGNWLGSKGYYEWHYKHVVKNA